jgi:hypothetical protein
LHLRAREILVTVVDRFELAAVNGDARGRQQAKLSAKRDNRAHTLRIENWGDRRPQAMPDDKKVHKASAAALAHIDELLDEALKQTFPASDPVAINIERASDERRERKSPLKPAISVV